MFDIKMDFTRKARWALDGNRQLSPEVSTYAGVVSRECVRMCVTYAFLNGVDAWACEIQHAYLQAPTTEKFYVIFGQSFGLEM